MSNGRATQRVSLLCAALSTFLAASAVQSQASTDSARALAARADTAFDESTAESLARALDLRHRAAALFLAAGDPRSHGAQLNGIGNIHYRLGSLDSALTYYQRALPFRVSAGDSTGYGRTLGNVGNVFADRGDTDSALVKYRQSRAVARALRNRADEATPVSNLGLLFYRLGQLDSALTYLTDALTIYRETNDRLSEAEMLHNMAPLMWSLDRADSALALERVALRLADSLSYRALRAGALTNIADIWHWKGYADTSLVYAQRALAEYDTIGDRRGGALVRHNMAIRMSELAQYDSALAYLHRALAVADETGDKPLRGRVLLNLGAVLNRMGDVDSSLAYLERSLAVRREVEDKAGEGKVLANIASVLAANGQSDSAWVLSRQALRLLRETQEREGQAALLGIIAEHHERRRSFDSALVYLKENLELARATGDRREEGEALSSTARVLMMQRRLETADTYFDSAATVKASVSRRAGGDFDRVSLADRESAMFDHWVRSWLLRRGAAGDTAATLAALAAHERGRAQALLDLMRDSSRTPGVKTTLAAEGALLVATATQGGATVVSYALVGDSILVWTARAGERTTLDVLPLARDTLVRLITDFRRSLGADHQAVVAARSVSPDTGDATRSGGVVVSGRSAWERDAQALAAILLPPGTRQRVRRGTRLVIVPQGVLALLPFTALPLTDTAAGKLLGDDIAIQYVPSLGTLRTLATTPRSRGVSTAPLVVGNPTMPRASPGAEFRGVLSPLPAAEREAMTVARILGVTPLVRDRASEATIRRRLSRTGVVHLATHGIAYSSRALARRSFLALAPGDGHDGILTVGEILDDPALRLQADLVVLSACQTGLGTPSEAEGTIGLQRAFLAKGSRAILVSLWDVSDAATQRLMERFYVYWRGSATRVSPAEALRRAQRDVRRIPTFAHPRYWAAFQLVGAPN